MPTPETAPIRTENPYALTKYLAERYVLHFASVYRLPALSLRLFNVYGPRNSVCDSFGPIISLFTRQKKEGKPFTVVGDGRQSRDFVFVTDVVDAFIRAAGSGITGEVFNVGSGEVSSICDIVTSLGGPVRRIPSRPDEVRKTQADITKIRKLLGWRPNIPFKQGMKAVLRSLDLNDQDDTTGNKAKIRKISGRKLRKSA
jgi:UDP-glucose 4-epimerase